MTKFNCHFYILCSTGCYTKKGISTKYQIIDQLALVQLWQNSLGQQKNECGKSYCVSANRKGDCKQLPYTAVSPALQQFVVCNGKRKLFTVTLSICGYTINEQQPCEQAGFRKNFSNHRLPSHNEYWCFDRKMQCIYQIASYFLLMDYTKVFDLVKQIALKKQEVPETDIKIVTDKYKNLKLRIRRKQWVQCQYIAFVYIQITHFPQGTI